MSDWRQKIVHQIKSLIADRETFIVILLVLVAVTSFGLGRQSVSYNQNSQETTPLKENPIIVNQEAQTVGAYYVASKNGEAYHLPFCSGAKRISEKNKITFETKEAAESAGYRPAANCPGL